jgi:U11/U12 small nuclear ribonucleoprotein SNRNP65
MAEDNTILLIRHLPSELSSDDKQDLLKHFGALRVRCFNSGRMKHTAFATFSSRSDAASALERLHQIEILGHKLCVEYSNSQMKGHHPTMVDPASTIVTDNKEELLQKAERDAKSEASKKKVTEQINSINAKWGVAYPYNPRLAYAYPSPTVNILTNIANALASVPRFYVQVLHLMNKMNLPPPFGAITATPPIPEGVPPEPPPLPAPSSEESELESDNDTPKSTTITRKRHAIEKDKPKKKPKFTINIMPPVAHRNDTSTQPGLRPEEVFDQSQTAVPKKIAFKLPLALGEPVENNSLPEEEPATHMLNFISVSEPVSGNHLNAAPSHDLMAQETIVEGGFGKIEPQKVTKETASSSDSEEEPWGATKFISSRKLRNHRLSRSESKDLSVLRNYNRGDPTPRLYIKNLQKQTSEKDLHYIFGRYVDWEDELEKNMFDIRLMKEGRMKGQAFVTLPNDKLAKEALEDTHLFVLNDKPMVVQFARSAKAKDGEGK